MLRVSQSAVKAKLKNHQAIVGFLGQRLTNTVSTFGFGDSPGQLYRQALERLHSLDELDQLLAAVDQKWRLILPTLAGLCVAVIVRSVFDPSCDRGRHGVLVNSGSVRGVRPPPSRQVSSVEFRIGQHFARGDVLHRPDQPELRKDLEHLRGHKVSKSPRTRAVAMDQQRQTLETDSAAKQRQPIVEQVGKIGTRPRHVRPRNKTFAFFNTPRPQDSALCRL